MRRYFKSVPCYTKTKKVRVQITVIKTWINQIVSSINIIWTFAFVCNNRVRKREVTSGLPLKELYIMQFIIKHKNLIVIFCFVATESWFLKGQPNEQTKKSYIYRSKIQKGLVRRSNADVGEFGWRCWPNEIFLSKSKLHHFCMLSRDEVVTSA